MPFRAHPNVFVRQDVRSPVVGDRGSVLLIVLLSMFAVGVMSMVLAQVAATEISISANVAAGQQTFLSADGAAQVLLRDLSGMARSLGRFPDQAELASIDAPGFSNVTLTRFDAFADGPVLVSRLADGLYVGLAAEIQPFRAVAATEAVRPPASTSTVEITGEFASIPLFQFGVLYEGNIEIHPGAPMSISGRVHGNGDIYVDPEEDVAFDATVTAHGSIYNLRRNGWASHGAVRIRDAAGVYQEMNGLDSRDPDWSSEAIRRWDGRVRTGDIGAERIDLTIQDPSHPRLLIERGVAADTPAERAAKIWYTADLRIVNGRGYDRNGNPVSLVDPLSGQSAVRFSVLYDRRELKHMLTVEVDVDKLGRSPAYPANGTVYLGAFQPDPHAPAWPGGAVGVGPAEWSAYGTPWNSELTEFAFKTKRAARLAGSLTLVSDNPVYVQGDFNTLDKRAAAIMADSVTVLSNNWGDVDGDGTFDGDLEYSLLPLEQRLAAPTTVNAGIMSGVVDIGADYNGGLENFVRLVEDWRGAQLTLLGSMVALWDSRYADGPYGRAGVFSPAIRDWRFDTDFLDLENLPPQTPRTYQIAITGWERH